MKSFQNYETPTKEKTPQNETLTAEELTKQLTEAYEGKSNVEMLKSILAEAVKSKRAGTLSNAELDEFYNAFSPMLDGMQRSLLRAIVEKLKQI